MWLCPSLINLFRHYHLIVRILTPRARKFSFGIIVTNDCVSVLSKIWVRCILITLLLASQNAVSYLSCSFDPGTGCAWYGAKECITHKKSITALNTGDQMEKENKVHDLWIFPSSRCTWIIWHLSLSRVWRLVNDYCVIELLKLNLLKHQCQW